MGIFSFFEKRRSVPEDGGEGMASALAEPKPIDSIPEDGGDVAVAEEPPLSDEERAKLTAELALLGKDISVLSLGDPTKEDPKSVMFKPIYDRIDEIEKRLGKK